MAHIAWTIEDRLSHCRKVGLQERVTALLGWLTRWIV